MSTTFCIPVFLVSIGLLYGLSMACDSRLPPSREWANDWDQPMHFECDNDAPINSMNSFWLSCKRDRVWSFECGTIGKKFTTSCYDWTPELNEWDEPLMKICPGDGYVSGLSSVHDNGKEDRRFKMKCCSARKLKTCGCYTTDLLNHFQGLLDYTVPNGEVLKGLYSYHRNDKEDRVWKAIICKLSK